MILLFWVFFCLGLLHISFFLNVIRSKSVLKYVFLLIIKIFVIDPAKQNGLYITVSHSGIFFQQDRNVY